MEIEKLRQGNKALVSKNKLVAQNKKIDLVIHRDNFSSIKINDHNNGNETWIDLNECQTAAVLEMIRTQNNARIIDHTTFIASL